MSSAFESYQKGPNQEQTSMGLPIADPVDISKPIPTKEVIDGSYGPRTTFEISVYGLSPEELKEKLWEASEALREAKNTIKDISDVADSLKEAYNNLYDLYMEGRKSNDD